MQSFVTNSVFFAMNKTSTTSSSSRKWSDLPGELVLEIANRLALIELHSFRGVCKDWRTATSKASAIVQPQSQPSHWLLTHENDNPICTFYNPQHQTRYTTNLPELATSTCIASNHGWLLLFNAGRIFFFSPFSREKIPLPDFPSSEVKDHVATFTNVPTSEECTVCVVHRKDSCLVETNVLVRGDDTWKMVAYDCRVALLGTVVGATYDKGKFYFLDDNDKLVTYEAGKEVMRRHNIVAATEPQVGEVLPFSYSTRYFEKSGVGKMMGLGDETSVSVCGGATREGHIVLNENIEAVGEEDGGPKRRRRRVKGIWVVQPRVPPLVRDEHKWCKLNI